MKNYELTIVLDGKASSAKKKAAQQKATSMVEAFKGKIGKVEDWGERELAYKIGKSETGHYIFIPLQMEAAGAKNLNDKLRLEEDLIRYLLVRV
ncbi:MAG: 30S ribosomal protein S6 [Patescibacteria group bacterium]